MSSYSRRTRIIYRAMLTMELCVDLVALRSSHATILLKPEENHSFPNLHWPFEAGEDSLRTVVGLSCTVFGSLKAVDFQYRKAGAPLDIPGSDSRPR